MDRQPLPIRFADLRRLAREVPAYLAGPARAWVAPALTASVENELAIAGDEVALLVLAFAETYQVNVEAFDFTDYLSPDGLGLRGCLLLWPVFLYRLAGGLLKSAAAGLCWLWRPALARRLWHWRLPAFWPPGSAPQTLTFGDFVASAAAGHFVRREQVQFQLLPA